MRISRLLSALLAAVFIIALPVPAPAQFAIGVGVNVGVAPPPIPVYTIPVAPDPNYMYTPGYWAWGAGGYYWVPGVWVAAPAVGVYWTPGYWGSYGGAYRWNAGYWGPRVGFYGGINYGFGYFGAGFVGGVWAGSSFRYNTAVWPVNRNIHNTYYNKTIINNYYNHSRVSYNGGHGGISARPTPAERSAYASRRYGPTPEQVTHARYAGQDRTLYAKVNGGRPPVTATTHAYNANNRPPHYGTVSRGTTVTHTNGTTHSTTHYNATTHSATHYNATTHTATHYNGTTHTTTHYTGTMHAQPHPVAHPAAHPPAPASHPNQGDEGHKPPKH